MGLFDLSGKHVLITGASSGIGRSIAVLSASLGATLTLIGRNEKRLNETLSFLSREGHKAICCDLTYSDSVNDMVDSLPLLDGIVYCAGIQETCLTKNVDNQVFDKLMDTNFRSTVLLNSQILKNKKLKKNSSVVFISSVAAMRCAEIGNAIYSSTKAAISSFARVLALELASRHIRVNIVSPGMVHTPLLDQFDMTAEQFRQDEQKYPLGYGNPEDVANTVVFLLSNATKWMTGSDIVLDGGLTLR
jgi:NAD(P)-dependent dehydrogenase (short-subunit alcohol dehydrogenase family)